MAHGPFVIFSDVVVWNGKDEFNKCSFNVHALSTSITSVKSFRTKTIWYNQVESIATSRGFPAELGKHPSNLNTRQENGGTHGNNALESHNIITLNIL